jgi:metal-sulfur cluster biosynthetic enzyme
VSSAAGHPRTTRADVEDALSTVVGPCSLAMGRRMDIVRLGKIEDVKVTGTTVTVCLIDDPLCFFFRSCRQAIEDALLDLPGIEEVELAFSTTTLWASDLIRNSNDNPVSTLGPAAV